MKIRFIILILLVVGTSSVNSLLGQNLVKPSRLHRGDTIGLIAPGWFITEKQLQESIKLNNLVLSRYTQKGF